MSKLSGIEINENGPVTGTVTGWTSRTFNLPATFKRGDRIPDITGLQFCHDVSDAENFAVDFRLELNLITGPLLLQSGSIAGTDASGTYIWSDIMFQTPVKVADDWLAEDFTVSVNSTSPTWITADGIRFRLLADVADSGEDFLGNKYRSVVVRNEPTRIDTQRLDQANAYWLSKPNPSKFAVESLYFDLRQLEDRPSVVDRVLIDPVTPGVLFHIYYSNDGAAGTNDAEWEDRLWSPVAKTFKAARRQEHALPTPISAKFVKVEFSHLQAQHYSPGTFHQSTVYKKHPKWVMDYFLARLTAEAVTNDPYIARRVGVTFDAFELAYSYFLDDLRQEPLHPENLSPQTQLTGFLVDRQDKSDQVDPATLQQIKLSLKPYTDHPGARGKGLNYLPALYTEVSTENNYPVERVIPAKANTVEVSNSNRTPLVIEQNYPAMFFYLTARHKYREVSASFVDDRAYFVGIRQLAFTRDIYTIPSDQEVYVDVLDDFTNVVRNDFVEDGNPPQILGGPQ
jgi:hypothetical protein